MKQEPENVSAVGSTDVVAEGAAPQSEWWLVEKQLQAFGTGLLIAVFLQQWWWGGRLCAALALTVFAVAYGLIKASGSKRRNSATVGFSDAVRKDSNAK